MLFNDLRVALGKSLGWKRFSLCFPLWCRFLCSIQWSPRYLSLSCLVECSLLVLRAQSSKDFKTRSQTSLQSSMLNSECCSKYWGHHPQVPFGKAPLLTAPFQLSLQPSVGCLKLYGNASYLPFPGNGPWAGKTALEADQRQWVFQQRHVLCTPQLRGFRALLVGRQRGGKLRSSVTNQDIHKINLLLSVCLKNYSRQKLPFFFTFKFADIGQIWEERGCCKTGTRTSSLQEGESV